MKLRTVSQLFNTLDPSPFRERDLAKEAEDYIVDYAEDVPKGVPIDIVLHLPAAECSPSSSSEIASAIKDYFGLRSHETTREMQELFRTGRFSLLVGLIVLSVCLMLGLFLSQKFQKGPFPDIFREGFLILGWVAIWRPSEIFLYAWPPLLRRRKLFERLMQARVTVECGDRDERRREVPSVIQPQRRRLLNEENAMSAPCRFEMSVLKHDEQEIIRDTHHPAIAEMNRERLQELRVMLRDLGNRERTLARHRRRQTKGKAEERGKSFSGTAVHANQRNQVFVAAIKRVNKELERLRKFEARKELGEAARRALALRRAQQFSRPQNEPRAHDGMRSLPSRRRHMKIPPSKIGRVSQANKRGQAKRDASRGNG